VGPVLLLELRLLASARFDEVLAVSLMVFGPIGGMCIGEVRCSRGRSLCVSHHRKGLPSSAFTTIIGNFQASHGTFFLFFPDFGSVNERLMAIATTMQIRSSTDDGIYVEQRAAWPERSRRPLRRRGSIASCRTSAGTLVVRWTRERSMQAAADHRKVRRTRVSPVQPRSWTDVNARSPRSRFDTAHPAGSSIRRHTHSDGVHGPGPGSEIPLKKPLAANSVDRLSWISFT
jgi:hypothetical protein